MPNAPPCAPAETPSANEGTDATGRDPQGDEMPNAPPCASDRASADDHRPRET